MITFILPSAQASVLSHSSPLSGEHNPLSQPANGIPTGTYFDHLVFIIMENAGMSNICGSGNNPPPCNGPDNPYMSGLANSYGLATRYVDLIGTSQPNYIGIMAATLNGCTSNCGPGTLTETNLVDRFDAAGLAWKAYMEDQTPVAGCDNNDHGFYEIAHNPFVAFHSVDANSTRCNRIVLANPANNSTCTGTDCALVKDLNSGSAPNFMWVTPNDCNNAHGNSACPNGCISSYTSPCEKAGDNYLKGLVPNILNSNTFKNTRAALFITFDEGSGFCPFNGSGEDCMYTVWAGPTTKTNSFSSSTLRNHYAFTKTIETNWGLATMTSNDAGATAMTEFFSVQSADFTIAASPSSLSFPFGNSANSTITLSSLGSFAGTVTLTGSSTPAGLTVTLNPTSITLTAGGTGTSTLTVSSSTIGNYTATVTGTSSGHIHNTTATVRVTPAPNFAVSVNPTSLSLTHAVSGIASPVTVNPTGDPTVFESSYLANSFYAKGLYWLFYEDSRNTCEHQAGCLTYTTSNNGSRWAAPTTVPIHITDSDFSVTTNGTSIFYARYNETSFINDCGRKLQLGIGNLSNSGTVTWQPEKTVTAGASNRVYVNDEIILDSNGQIWIAYLMDNHGACGGNSTDLPLVIHSAGTNYNSWTGNFTFNTVNSGNWHIALVSLGNGQVYAAYWIGAHDVHGRIYNNGWQADEQISTPTTLSDVNGWLFNSGTNVYTIYFDDLTESFNFATRSSTGTWTVNTIGIGESHTGFSGYYSLPDAASYDLANNQFHLFYMNGTNQRIDEWTGSGSSWNKTTGVVSTGAVPYPDSITSFIQSSPTEVGGIFYTSGSASPFTIKFAALSFASTSLTGSFTVTVTSQNGFTGTVTLSTATAPSTGLTVICTVTTITGGSGSSTCNLSSTTPGTYNVNVTGVSGSLSHSANVAVTVPAGSDFSVTATAPSPTSVRQSQTSTITVMALNGFTGIVSLTDTLPTGLACGAITPSSITNSGTATVSCSATLPGNYTLTITGTSGTLNHSTNILYQFRDFNASASSPAPSNAGTSIVSTLTITAINHFNAAVTLTDVVPSGLICGSISPSSLTGSGTATVSCSSSTAGNYTLTITGTSGSLVHNATALFQFRDFTIAASSITINAGASGTSTITIATLNSFAGTVALTDTVPSGLICGSITPGSVTGSGTATVSCSANIAANYTLTITGTSGSLVHTATPIIHVQDFGITASAPAPVKAGSSATSTITITATNHFSGIVSLTDTTPTGLTCATITPNSLTGSGTATVSCSATIAGNYALTLTGTSGSLVHTATAVFNVTDFSVSATSPAAVTVGTSTTSTITVAAINGFMGTVSLTDTIPANLTCGAITPTSVTNSGTAAVACSSTIAATYTLTITGTSGTLSHSTTVTFTITEFTITATSPSAVNAGVSTASTITINAVNGFTGTVSLTDTVPANVSCSAINPTSVTNSGTATVACSSTTAATYTLTITGTSGTLTHFTTATFTVTDFSISATSPAAVNAGVSATSTITVAALNGFTGTVGLTDTVPANSTCGAISPTSVTNSGTATVACSSTVAATYTLTITATSGTLSHSTTATFTVRDFSIAATSPAAATVGTSATSTITISALNGFTGTVSLTDTVPANLTCGAITPNNITNSGTATLACSSTVAANYVVTITGTSGTLSHSATSTITVTDFTIAATSPGSVNVGTSATSTITITAVNGFTGTISLTDTVPANLTCGATTPTSVTGSGTATVSCSSTVAANYVLTITGTSGTLSHSTTATFTVRDFTISASSPAAVNAGASATSTVTVSAVNGFTGTVSLTDTVPANLTCGAIAPGSVVGSGTATVSCKATVAGNYTLNFTGTSGALSHSTTIVVSVQDFTISANPAMVEINANSTGSSVITITSLNNFSGTVSLSASGTTGLITAINPVSIAGGAGTATLTFSSSTPGNYTVTITGSNGTLTHTTSVSVQVVDFGIVASPSVITILSGARGNSTVTVTAQNGFSGTVNLVLTPSMGLSATIVPSSFTGSGSSLLSVTASTAGDYSLTIKATSGTLSHMIGIVIHVLDYGLAGNPTNLVAPIGSSASSTLTINSLNGYAGNVSLTYTAQIASISPGNSGAGGGRGSLIMAPPNPVLPIVSIFPQTFQLSTGGTQQSTVSISLPSNLPAGNYLITVNASDGILLHQIVLTVVATDFSITATPNSATISSGSNTTIVLNLQSLNFFQGNVTLTITSQAGGPIGTVGTTTVQLTYYGNVNVNLTIQVPSTTAAGNYTVTVQATSGTVSHTLSIPVRVTTSGFITVLTEMLNHPNSTSISAIVIFTFLSFSAASKIRACKKQKPRVYRLRVESRIFRNSRSSRLILCSSGAPVLWGSQALTETI